MDQKKISLWKIIWRKFRSCVANVTEGRLGKGLEALASAVTFAITIFTFTGTQLSVIAVISFSIFIFFLFKLVVIFSGATYADLEKELESTKQELEDRKKALKNIDQYKKEVFDGLAFLLHSEIFNSNDKHYNTRITIYSICKTREFFKKIGRYCPNEKFRGEGRPTYPINHGAIGVGYAEKWHFNNAMSNMKDAEIKKYFKTRYKIKNPSDLTMLARVIAVYSLENRINMMGTICGIVVIETTEPYGVEEDIEKDLGNQTKFLHPIIEKYEQHISPLSIVEG